jgi:hypothetical protein
MRAAVSVVFWAFVPFGLANAETPAMVSALPPGYGFLTLQSGHTYKYLTHGPLFGNGGKKLAIALSYVSDTADPAKLQTAAQELFEYMRPVADIQKEEAVVIVAQLNYEPRDPISKTVVFNVAFKKGPDGKWSKVPAKASPPALERAASHVEIIRDTAGEEAALADAEVWLALFDQDKYGETWEASSPLLKGFASKARWETQWSPVRPELGRLISRARIATLSTRRIQGGPPSSYVIFEYRTKYERKPDSFESITEMLCEDGKWRVAGFFIRN